MTGLGEPSLPAPEGADAGPWSPWPLFHNRYSAGPLQKRSGSVGVDDEITGVRPLAWSESPMPNLRQMVWGWSDPSTFSLMVGAGSKTGSAVARDRDEAARPAICLRPRPGRHVVSAAVVQIGFWYNLALFSKRARTRGRAGLHRSWTTTRRSSNAGPANCAASRHSAAPPSPCAPVPCVRGGALPVGAGAG